MSILNQTERKVGFTLVEVCVIIAILGILAGVVMVGYGTWRTQVAKDEVRSDLNGVAAGMGEARNFENGFPVGLPSAFTASRNVLLSYVSGDASNYCIDGRSKVASSVTYFIDTVRTGGVAMHGTCALGETPEGYDPSGPGWNGVIATGGGGHRCGIASGKAYCWGSNTKGQLGDNTLVSSDTPVAVYTGGALGGKTVTAIAVGGSSACAIANAEVYCWGDNLAQNSPTWNVLGADLPPMQRSSVPLAMNALRPTGVLVGKTVTAISGTGSHYCVIADGAIYCWGWNFYGQLGVGNSTYNVGPVAVSTAGVLNGKTPTALASNYHSTCAIASGQVYCWGNGTDGQLGRGAITASSNIPTAVNTSGVLSGKTVTAIAGLYASYCVIADGAAYCWGDNALGQLGNGSTTDTSYPVAVNTGGVLAGKTLTSIIAAAHTCALGSGAIYCWGYNFYGQLGDGTTTNSTTPVATVMSGVLSGKTVSSISLNGSTTCAYIMATSENFCWGSGPMGHGPAGNFTSPIKVNAP